MTIHRGRPISGWVLFTALMILFLCYIFFPPDRKPMTDYNYQELTGNVNEPILNDTLPHYKYQRIKDSLASSNLKDDYFHNRGGSGIKSAHLGFYKYDSDSMDEYFLIISGYDHDENVSVTNKRMGSLLTYPVWDKVEEKSRSGHLENKSIGIKYEEGKGRWQGKVFAPVTKSFGRVFIVVFYVFLILTAIVCFYCVLFIPVRFLYQLAKGEAFVEENIGNLYFTGWGLISIGLFLTIITILAHLFVRSKIPAELTFSYYAAIMAYGKYFLAGLSILLLAKAFVQGLALKEEQDLTV